MLNQFNLLVAQQNNLQSQVSTGLRVQAPSDDPDGDAEHAELSRQPVHAGAIQREHFHLADRAPPAWTACCNRSRPLSSRAGEIATSAGSATNSQSDLNNYADEVNSLINQVVNAANTKDPSTGQLFVWRHGLRFRAVHDHDGCQRQRDRRDLQRQQHREPGADRRGHDGLGGRSGREHQRHRRRAASSPTASRARIC